MTESQFPTDPNPVTEFLTRPKTKGVRVLIILLVTGAIFGLIALIYNALFPKAYWQSRELEQNQAKWESQHINHYRMSLVLPFSSNHFGLNPLTVEVQDGKVISAVDVRGEIISPEDDQEFAYLYPLFTIPGLFSDTYKKFWGNPEDMEVSYDPSFGYPSSIYINQFAEPCCQGYTITVTNFQILSP